MPEFPTITGGVVRTVGAVSGTSSLATQLSADAVANTKGAFVELTAATEFDSNWVLVMLTQLSISQTPYLVDIAIGSATEQVIVPDLFCIGTAANGSFGPYLFPVFVPKGSRLSARVACASGGQVVRVAVTLVSGIALGGGSGPSYVSAYGSTTGSQGTSIDPGGVANTDSSWVEITPATDRAHNWIVVSGRFGDLSTGSAAAFRLSVGIGGATEQVLIPDLHYALDATADAPVNPVICLPCFIPAGSRLTAMVRSSTTTASDRTVNLKLYGAG